jgi:hypothetical protein
VLLPRSIDGPLLGKIVCFNSPSLNVCCGLPKKTCFAWPKVFCVELRGAGCGKGAWRARVLLHEHIYVHLLIYLGWMHHLYV